MKELLRCRLLITFWALLSFAQFGWALTVIDPSCTAQLRNNQLKFDRNLLKAEDIRELRIMSYNVENLYQSTGKHEYVSIHEYRNLGPKRKPIHKPDEKTNWLGRVIRENNPDLLVGVEIESLESARNFVQEKLNGEYAYFLFDGNDPRGIKVGFLIRKNLPYNVEILSHKDRAAFDPIEKRKVKVFSRDVPAAVIREEGKDKPFLIVLGNHAKSKRHRNGDHESSILRTLQYEAIAGIIKEMQARYGEDVPIILTGDFNTDTRVGPELKPIRAVMSSAFDHAPNPIPKEERITHSYHPAESSQDFYNQLDDFMITQNLQNRVKDARIVPYVNSNGETLPLPTSFEERSQQPSDHRAIVLDIKLR